MEEETQRDRQRYTCRSLPPWSTSLVRSRATFRHDVTLSGPSHRNPPENQFASSHRDSGAGGTTAPRAVCNGWISNPGNRDCAYSARVSDDWGHAEHCWLKNCLARDNKGFIVTGHDLATEWFREYAVDWHSRPPFLLETSLPGVFAVGDARAGNVKRVAAAVGEGSISVHLVHRVLAEM